MVCKVLARAPFPAPTRKYGQARQGGGVFNSVGGTFFVPVRLEPLLVAACWQESGGFPCDHEVFSPLRKALNKLEHSVTVFDAVFVAQIDALE